MKPYKHQKLDNAENLVEDGVDKEGNPKFRKSNKSFRKLQQKLNRIISNVKKETNTSKHDHSKLYEYAKTIDEDMEQHKVASELEKNQKQKLHLT